MNQPKTIIVLIALQLPIMIFAARCANAGTKDQAPPASLGETYSTLVRYRSEQKKQEQSLAARGPETAGTDNSTPFGINTRALPTSVPGYSQSRQARRSGTDVKPKSNSRTGSGTNSPSPWSARSKSQTGEAAQPGPPSNLNNGQASPPGSPSNSNSSNSSNRQNGPIDQSKMTLKQMMANFGALHPDCKALLPQAMGGDDARDQNGNEIMKDFCPGTDIPGAPQMYTMYPPTPSAAVRYPKVPSRNFGLLRDFMGRMGWNAHTPSDAQQYAMNIQTVTLGANMMQYPEYAANRAQAAQSAQMTSAGNALGNMSKDQASSAINYCSKYMINFTTDSGNQWNTLRDQIFIPMAILLLLPGAVLTQVRAIVAAGAPIAEDPVLGYIVNPFDGILRSIVGVFLIPATFLVVNYGIDVSNSITYTLTSQYQRLFGSDMYKDALCAQVRAFPTRSWSENQGAANSPTTSWPETDTTDQASLERNMFESKIDDPCTDQYSAPPERADEAMPSSAVFGRALSFGTNAMLTSAWNVLCAFQMAYLTYLFLVGPVIAALWVWPLRQLQSALPAWVEGCVTVCFWSLFWNTVILLMACFKGVSGETGTIMMSALNFLATAAVKYGFDFVGLAREVGQHAAQEAMSKGQGKGKGKGGAGGGKGGQQGKGAAGSGTGAHGRRPVGAPSHAPGAAAGALRGVPHGVEPAGYSHGGNPEGGTEPGGDVGITGAAGVVGAMARSIALAGSAPHAAPGTQMVAHRPPPMARGGHGAVTSQAEHRFGPNGEYSLFTERSADGTELVKLFGPNGQIGNTQTISNGDGTVTFGALALTAHTSGNTETYTLDTDACGTPSTVGRLSVTNNIGTTPESLTPLIAGDKVIGALTVPTTGGLVAGQIEISPDGKLAFVVPGAGNKPPAKFDFSTDSSGAQVTLVGDTQLTATTSGVMEGLPFYEVTGNGVALIAPKPDSAVSPFEFAMERLQAEHPGFSLVSMADYANQPVDSSLNTNMLLALAGTPGHQEVVAAVDPSIGQVTFLGRDEGSSGIFCGDNGFALYNGTGDPIPLSLADDGQFFAAGTTYAYDISSGEFVDGDVYIAASDIGGTILSDAAGGNAAAELTLQMLSDPNISQYMMAAQTSDKYAEQQLSYLLRDAGVSVPAETFLQAAHGDRIAQAQVYAQAQAYQVDPGSIQLSGAIVGVPGISAGYYAAQAVPNLIPDPTATPALTTGLPDQLLNPATGAFQSLEFMPVTGTTLVANEALFSYTSPKLETASSVTDTLAASSPMYLSSVETGTTESYSSVNHHWGYPSATTEPIPAAQIMQSSDYVDAYYTTVHNWGHPYPSVPQLVQHDPIVPTSQPVMATEIAQSREPMPSIIARAFPSTETPVMPVPTGTEILNVSEPVQVAAAVPQTFYNPLHAWFESSPDQNDPRLNPMSTQASPAGSAATARNQSYPIHTQQIRQDVAFIAPNRTVGPVCSCPEQINRLTKALRGAASANPPEPRTWARDTTTANLPHEQNRIDQLDPIARQGGYVTGDEKRKRAKKLLQELGLPPSMLDQNPMEV